MDQNGWENTAISSKLKGIFDPQGIIVNQAAYSVFKCLFHDERHCQPVVQDSP